MTNSVTFGIQPHYFAEIAAGKKRVEGRLKKPKLETLKVGNIVQFICEDERQALSAVVTFLHTYQTFRMMLQQEGLEKCLPGIATLEEAVAIYHALPGYLEGESRYGVVAIGLSLY